jgi:sulfur dioxygenase
MGERTTGKSLSLFKPKSSVGSEKLGCQLFATAPLELIEKSTNPNQIGNRIMIFKQVFDRETWTFTYILADAETRQALIIDPVMAQIERDLALLSELDLDLLYSLDTHVHADHITAAGMLRTRTGAKCAVGEGGQVIGADLNVSTGDQVPFGRYRIDVRETPGHTPGCVTYLLHEPEHTLAFTGDALLVRGCGRTDFQNGSAQQLYRSVHEQIFTLPDDTVIYPGHDYNGYTASTVGEEKAYNPRLRLGIGESDFIQIMANLDLAPPKNIDEAVPANQQCGDNQGVDSR